MDNAEMYQMIVQAITESNDELTMKIDDVRSDLTAKINDARSDLNAKIDDVRTEMNVRFEVVNNRFDKLDTDMDYLKSKILDHDRDIFMLKKKIIV
jgi:chaperonin cofactor prefoldin